MAAERRYAAQKRFPRGEAVAKIGSSEPILVTDEESGQKSNWQYIRQTHSRIGFESPVEVFSLPVSEVYLPHSSSAPSGHRNCGMIATGNHIDYKIRCALQHSPGEGIGPTASNY